ncbi:MAG: hypothetical protein KGL39_04815 [Patescibacteria group bacterium]|nr:hypothetical protein [Patescibacteria group bacterium]
MKSPDKELLRMIALWNAGNSASQIGAVFNISRNAVIGRIHRVGARFPELITRVEPKAAQRRRERPAPSIATNAPKPIPKPALILDTSNQISLLEIKGNRCRYIVKDEGSICCENDGFPWCNFHAAVCQTSVPISREDRAKAEEATIAYGLRRTAA